jgi:hypothetical protein
MQRYASVRRTTRALRKETKEERNTRKGMNDKSEAQKNEITCLQVLMRTGRTMQEEDEKEKGIIKIRERETGKKKLMERNEDGNITGTD